MERVRFDRWKSGGGSELDVCTLHKGFSSFLYALVCSSLHRYLSKEELGIVAKHIWTADIQSAKNYVTQLQVRDPVDHVHLLLGTKKATKSHLKSLYGRLPHNKWADEVLPELQRAELKRLNKIVSKN